MNDIDELVDDIRLLVECESPSSDLDAVARSADVVARLGTVRLGSAPERIVIDGRTHLRWRLGEEPSRVLLVCHHDTVWPIGSLAAESLHRGGDSRRPGAARTRLLRHEGWAGDGVPRGRRDSRASHCWSPVMRRSARPAHAALIEDEARRAEAALVLESSADGGALKIERKGTSWYVLEITGRAAHAGLEPERGVNATVELAHQVLALESLADAVQGTTVTPTMAHSGASANTVPAFATVTIDVRARTVAEQERVDAAIRALRPAVQGASLQVVGSINRPPLESSAALELYERARTVAARLGLPIPESAAVGGGSDGNFTAGVGTPTLDGLGAVGDGAHADHEHVLVDMLPARTILLRGLIEDLLRDGVTRH